MKHRSISFITASLIAASLIASPLAFAKDNGNKGNGHGEDNDTKPKVEASASVTVRAATGTNEHNENENGNSDRGCVRAFGHLIAPGWIKHNGQINLGSECALPPGIWAKIFGGKHGDDHHGTSTGTTTPPVVDTTSPVISNLAATSTRPHTATVRWMTNENADSTVWFSTSSPVNTATAASVSSSNRVTNHSFTLTNLASSTTYHIVVRSRDAAGNVSTSSEITVTTPAQPVVAVLPIIGNAVATVGTSTAHLTWTTNVNADSQAYFSTTSPVVIGASSTTAVTDSNLVTNHSLNVTGLATSTTYNMVIKSTDSVGNTAATGQFSLTTSF